MEHAIRLHGAGRLPAPAARGSRSLRCVSQRDAPRPAGPHAASRPNQRPAAAGGARGSGPRGAPATQHPSDPSQGGEDIVGWMWTGSDEFSGLGDRKDEPPLALPHLRGSTRMVLVRHGQSTWNARNRIQGSSNFAVLTDLGKEQAAVAQQLLADWEFQCMFFSPLKRAAQTSEIVWGGRCGPTVTLPSLREIDLYSFQGLDKVESRTQYGEQYRDWQGSPAEFMIDGHAPVRELWYRASLAWREMLYHKQLRGGCGLVVAHNAVNQALLCTALGLPPTFFRRFAQSNAAFTVLDFEGGGGEGGQRVAAAPRVRVERMNQFPDRPLNPSKLGKSVPNRLVLVSGEATSPAVQASLNLLASSGATAPPLIGIGSTAQQVLDITTAMQAALATPGDGRSVVAVASGEACQQLLGACLGAAEAAPAPPPGQAPAPGAGQQQAQAQGQEEQVAPPARGAAAVGSLFHMSNGGITIVNWPSGQRELTRGTVLCTNYQLHPGLVAAAS